jgi:hypothetical protein
MNNAAPRPMFFGALLHRHRDSSAGIIDIDPGGPRDSSIDEIRRPYATRSKTERKTQCSDSEIKQKRRS